MENQGEPKYWYVYLLKCADNSSYRGCTCDLKERLTRHKKGQVSFTRSKLPIELITCVAFKNKYKAFEFEKYLKSGSGRAFAKKRLL
jgi:putative endonuclease